jgi:hypothetical protein
MRFCKHCLSSKSEEDFYATQIYCKECMLWYIKNLRERYLREGASVVVQRLRCRRCQAEKDAEDFARDRGLPRGRETICRACKKESRREQVARKQAEAVLSRGPRVLMQKSEPAKRSAKALTMLVSDVLSRTTKLRVASASTFAVDSARKEKIGEALCSAENALASAERALASAVEALVAAKAHREIAEHSAEAATHKKL